MNYGNISAYIRVTSKHFEATLTYLSTVCSYRPGVQLPSASLLATQLIDATMPGKRECEPRMPTYLGKILEEVKFSLFAIVHLSNKAEKQGEMLLHIFNSFHKINVALGTLKLYIPEHSAEAAVTSTYTVRSQHWNQASEVL